MRDASFGTAKPFEVYGRRAEGGGRTRSFCCLCTLFPCRAGMCVGMGRARKAGVGRPRRYLATERVSPGEKGKRSSRSGTAIEDRYSEGVVRKGASFVVVDA